MKKSKKNESITDNLFFIKKGLSHILKENEEINREKIDIYIKTIDEIIIMFNGIRRIILVLFFGIIICIGIIILMKIYETKVENFNVEIKNYKSDSLVRKILQIKEFSENDSTTTTSYKYITRNDSVVTYNQLVKESDSLQKELLLKEFEINKKENYINSKNKEVNLLKDKLDLAISNYNINFFETKTDITIVAKKLDSALVLLEIYRDRMIYDKDTGRWKIKN
jgi:predicted GIY-YIG superfamily endonuclease